MSGHFGTLCIKDLKYLKAYHFTDETYLTFSNKCQVIFAKRTNHDLKKHLSPANIKQALFKCEKNEIVIFPTTPIVSTQELKFIGRHLIPTYTVK